MVAVAMMVKEEEIGPRSARIEAVASGDPGI